MKYNVAIHVYTVIILVYLEKNAYKSGDIKFDQIYTPLPWYHSKQVRWREFPPQRFQNFSPGESRLRVFETETETYSWPAPSVVRLVRYHNGTPSRDIAEKLEYQALVA